MTKPGKRKRDGRQAAADAWERWQLFASVARIVIEIVQPWLDRIAGGGPGRLL